MNAAPVTEAELHAYVDGALPPELARFSTRRFDAVHV